jgi:hypothetical protein
MADMWVLNTGGVGADHGLPGGQSRLHHPRHHHTLHFLPLVSHICFSFSPFLLISGIEVGCYSTTLQRQNAENLKQIFPEKEYWALSPNPNSCVCEQIIYSHNGSAFSAGGNMWTDPGNI